MGFRNPLGGIPPSSITGDLIADGAFDGKTLNGVRLTAVQGISIGPLGQELTGWGWREVSGTVNDDGQIVVTHNLGGAPTAAIAQLHDVSHDQVICPLTLAAGSVTFQAYDAAAGTPLPAGTAVRFYVNLLRG